MDPGLYFLNFAHVCLVISLSILLFNWKNLSRANRCLGYYLIWNFLIELGAWAFQAKGINNLPLLHLYTLGEFILFSLFYREILPKIYFVSKNQLAIGVFVCMLIIGNSLFVQSIFGFNSYAKTLIQVILIGYGLSYFFGEPAMSIGKDTQLNWINSAVLIYYSGTLFIYLFSDFFLRFGDGIPKEFWMFNAFLNLIFHIFILIAISKIWMTRWYSYEST